MHDRARPRPRYWLSAVIAVVLALVGTGVCLWPEQTAALGLLAVAVGVILYGLIRSARVRRALLWTLVVALCVSVVLLALFALTPYGMVLLIIGAGQLAAVLYFWPRRTFRHPIIRREMMEPLPRFRDVT